MSRDLLVYISGPMTAKDGRTIEQNVADGVAVFAELIRLGIPAFCPHLNGAYASLWDISHAEWIAYDCAILDRCTHLLMMPRWETSKGAQLELSHWVQSRQSTYNIAYSVAELCEMVGVDRDAVRDTAGRLIAPPQLEPAPRPDGPHRTNHDAREPVR